MMTQIALVGIAAGVASALLFAAPLGGTGFAWPLFILTGLPIAIAGLGWTATAALIATAVAALAAFATLSLSAAAILTLIFGLPITWLTRQAALSRPTSPDDLDSPREWYPIGGLLFHAAIAVGLGAVATALVVGYDPAEFSRQMVGAVSAWLASSSGTATTTEEQIEAFVRLNVAILPISLGILLLGVVVIDLWLGARIAAMSGRLKRPRDPLWTTALPRNAVIGFCVAILIALFPGPIGGIGKVFVGTFGCALAMVGLAVMHALSLGNGARGFILAFAYAALIILGFPLILFAFLGIAETLLHFRARRFAGAPPTT
jgi:hypothetical protein